MAQVALLGYNRRLGLLIAAATFWALLGIAASLGMVRGADQPPPLSLSLGVPPGGVLLHGDLLAIEQNGAVLRLTIGRPTGAPDSEPSVAELPDDIEVTFETVEPRGPGQPRRTPPEISLGPPQHPRRLPGGGHLLVAERYAVKFGRGEVRVFPRPAGREGEWLRRMFGREDEPIPPPPPDGRPGAGPPGGGPPGGQPGDGMQRQGPRGGAG